MVGNPDGGVRDHSLGTLSNRDYQVKGFVVHFGKTTVRRTLPSSAKIWVQLNPALTDSPVMEIRICYFYIPRKVFRYFLH